MADETDQHEKPPSGASKYRLATIDNICQGAVVEQFDDVLKRVMGEDPPKIKKEQFRVIYESENFPTAGFGSTEPRPHRASCRALNIYLSSGVTSFP